MTLFFYVLKEYLKYVFGTLVLCVFLFILFDLIHKTTKYFAEYNPSSEQILRYYIYQIPNQLVQALPIAALLASVICMILLSRTNEITAMRAAGMGPMQIAKPLAVGGILLGIFALVVGETLVPNFAERRHYVQKVLIEGESDTEIAEGARWIRDGQTLVNFGDYDPISRTLSKVRIVEVMPNFRIKTILECQEAFYQETDNSWKLTDVKVFFFKRNGTLDFVEKRLSQLIKLPFEPQKLKKQRRTPNEMSIGELRDLVRQGRRSGANTLPYQVDFHLKLAYPFAAFVVSLIGLKFGYRSERTTETVKGVMVAVMIGIFYWVVLSWGRALGRRGDIHPFLAAWLANVVILAVTVFDAWRARRYT